MRGRFLSTFNRGVFPRETHDVGFALSDETTALTTGQKIAFDWPYPFVIVRAYASIVTAPTGSSLTIDIEDEGTTILSAAAALVISASANNGEHASFASSATSYRFDKGDLCSIDIDQVGSTIAGAGLKVWLIGYRP